MQIPTGPLPDLACTALQLELVTWNRLTEAAGSPLGSFSPTVIGDSKTMASSGLSLLQRALQIWLCCWCLASAMEPPGVSRVRARVPRIGRRGGGFAADYDEFEPGLSDGSYGFIHKSWKAIPRLGRRQNYLPDNDDLIVDDNTAAASKLSMIAQLEKAGLIEKNKIDDDLKTDDNPDQELNLAKLMRTYWQRKALNHALWK